VLTAPQKACLSALPCPAADGKQHAEREGQPQPANERGWERQGKQQSHDAATPSSWAVPFNTGTRLLHRTPATSLAE